jgi:hypothetical protein
MIYLYPTQNLQSCTTRLTLKAGYIAIRQMLSASRNRRSFLFNRFAGNDTPLHILHGWNREHNVEHGIFKNGTQSAGTGLPISALSTTAFSASSSKTSSTSSI